jgi:hypothetical protein
MVSNRFSVPFAPNLFVGGTLLAAIGKFAPPDLALAKIFRFCPSTKWGGRRYPAIYVHSLRRHAAEQLRAVSVFSGDSHVHLWNPTKVAHHHGPMIRILQADKKIQVPLLIFQLSTIPASTPRHHQNL